LTLLIDGPDLGPIHAQRSRRFLPGTAGYLDHVVEAIRGLDQGAIADVASALWEAWEDDRAVYIIGNGGSASTATHMACDLAKQTQLPGRRPLRAIALNDNPALLTALANDTDYSQVFSEALNIYARQGDVLVAISCSGRSPNILAGIQKARSIGMQIITFGSGDGGKMAQLADLSVDIPSADYGAIESGHLLIEHCITHLLYEYGKLRAERRPSVFVDRDGVIVRNREDYVKAWDEVELLPGAVDALARLSKSGRRVFVVTNQSAVGRGLISRDALDDIHARIADEVAELGGRIEAFIVCPHHPDENCDCRKPSPGLLVIARDRYGVDLDRTVMIGDHETDLEAASRAGVDSILVLSGRATAAPVTLPVRHVAPDLSSAAEYLLT
jgi:histidinol-phosphate phosphatase family protein